MIKLIYPNGLINDDELKELIDLAIEYRTFVLEQNFNINKDFKLKRDLNYSIF